MFYEIIQDIRNQAQSFAAPYTTVEHGAMPVENGLAMFMGPGYNTQMHFDKGGEYDIYVVFNGKHSNLQTLVTSMSAVHIGLTQARIYSEGTQWSILNIETLVPPNYLDREESGTRQWLYGSMFRVKIYIKGDC